MADPLETALTRTLSAAAEAAPEQPIDLLHRVDVGFRRRRRRHRRYSAMAGMAAFVVMIGAAVWAGEGSVPQPKPTTAVQPAPPAPLPSLAVDKPGPVAQEWPEAYHTIPAKLPNGRKITPQQMLNEREVLVTTEAGFEHPDQLWVMELETGDARLLARIPEPAPRKTSFASHYTVGSGHVVWSDTYKKAGKDYTRIWKVRLPGGEPALVTTVPGRYGSIGQNADRLVVHRGTIYLSDGRGGGVREVPLAGGASRPVAGTTGYQIMFWPWIGSPGACEVWPPAEDGCGYTPATLRMFTELRNVDTGVRHTVTLPESDLQELVCSVNYCFAGSKANKDRHVVFTRDGRLIRELPGIPALDALPMWDRFVVVGQQEKQNFIAELLYDMKTGRYADLGVRQEPDGSVHPARYWDAGSRLLFWPVDKQESYAIVDIGAIR